MATHSPRATSRSTASKSALPGPKDLPSPRTSSINSHPGDDPEDRAGEGREARAIEQPALLREDGDRGERDGDLEERHRDREVVVRMERVLAVVVSFLGLGLERLGVLLDLLLLAGIALRFGGVLLLGFGIRGDARRELRQVLLHALRLVVVPLVRGLGLAQHRLVLADHRLVLRVAAAVAHDGAHRGEHRREDGDLLPQPGRLARMLDRVVVRPVYVYSVSRHSLLPAYIVFELLDGEVLVGDDVAHDVADRHPPD